MRLRWTETLARVAGPRWAVLGRCSARCWPGRAAGRAGPRWAEMKRKNFVIIFQEQF